MGAAMIRELIGYVLGFTKRERELLQDVSDLRERNERLLREDFIDTARPVGEMRLSGEWMVWPPADGRIGAFTVVWKPHGERIH
jgi:hypothetical protein